MNTLENLRAQLDKAPDSRRTHQARNYLRIGETHLKLAQMMLEHGLEDSPKPHKPTWTQRLQIGLEAGTFKPANAATLLDDLNSAAAGNRAAQERIVAYLNLPGVLEALGDD